MRFQLARATGCPTTPLTGLETGRAEDWVLEIPDKTLRKSAAEGLLDFLKSRGQKQQAEKWAWRVEEAR